MYLHFDLTNNIFLDSFPPEIGKTSIGLEKNKLSSIYYKIDGDDFIDKESKLGKIKDISRINFFIGSNNSGKSRFLRGIFKFNEFFISEDNISPLQLLYKIQDIVALDEPILPFDNTTTETIKKAYVGLSDLFLNPHRIPQFEKKIIELQLLLEKENNKDFKNLLELTFLYTKKLLFHNKNKCKSKIYVPILRTLITDQNLGKESFSKISETKYGIKSNIYTGQNLYDSFFELHNSEKIIELEEFTSWIKKNFYSNQKIQLIPNKNKNCIFLKVDNEMQPIFDIGDGIQQLILLTFPIFTSDDNTCFFIEEPETHLHPGLQRIFIDTLLNDEHLKSKNLRYFFSTHSNHFLDLSLQSEDISVFQFQKEGQDKFNVKNVKPNKETLDLLGVNNSSVLMANSSIWVEGPTDRKYISKFLKLFCEQNKIQHLKEDIDFAFFEYGGNLIAHYLFDEDFDTYYNENDVKTSINAFASANKIYLLADNDNASGKKLLRGEKLKNLSNNEEYFKYKNTDVVEIENLLPKEIIKSFLKTLVKKDSEKIDKIVFSQEDYKETRLGKFLFDLLIKNGFEESDFFKFKAKSGTLVNDYKLKLCEFLINGEFKYQDLILDNNQLDDIVVNLYNFIKPK